MTSRQRALTTSFTSLLLAGGCSENKKATQPNDPPIETPKGGLSGRVTLVSSLFTESGEKTGERSIEDVDSLRIYLLPATGGGSTESPLDSTFATDGAYRFDTPPSGSYRVGVRIGWWRWVASETFAWQDSTSGVPLFTVMPQGPLENAPNPFDRTTGVGIQGSLAQPQFLATAGFSMSGRTEFYFEYKAPAGFFHIHMTGAPPSLALPAGPHWTAVRWQDEVWFNPAIAETEP